MVDLINPNNDSQDLHDYKFFCFNGKVGMKWVDYNRFVDHKRVLYSSDGKRLDVQCTYDNPSDFTYPDIEFDILQPLAEKLSEGFPHVRIDLYCVNRHPYFGEMTFFSGAGYEMFNPDEYDEKIGEQFVLPREI